jgi:hypothetical protein
MPKSLSAPVVSRPRRSAERWPRKALMTRSPERVVDQAEREGAEHERDGDGDLEPQRCRVLVRQTKRPREHLVNGEGHRPEDPHQSEAEWHLAPAVVAHATTALGK